MSTFLEQAEGDDLDVFLDTEAGFAVTAIYTSAKDGLKELSVIFDKEAFDIDPDMGDIETTVPVATAKTADVENVRHKDELEIGGVRYEVKRIRPDGTGLTALVLGEI